MDQKDQNSEHAPSSPEPEQSSQQDPTQPAPATAKKSKKGFLVLLCLVLLIAGAFLAVWVYNETTLQKPLQSVLASDPRNSVVTAKAHFDGLFDTQSVVFDITDLSEHASQADVFRVFLQYAKALKEHHYKQVILAAYGQKKFIVPGDYFQQLGTEYDSQNPMYTIRTFSHHVTTMDGSHPFVEYEGGLLGVVSREMEQFSDMNKQWYLNEYMARHK